jgi:type II secretory pathway component GspD/PulD (secretin)
MRYPLFVLLVLASCHTYETTYAPVGATRVVPLENAAAPEVADELNRLAAPARSAGPDTEPSFVVVADERTNSLIVKSVSGDLEHVLGLIAELDRKVEPKSH